MGWDWCGGGGIVCSMHGVVRVSMHVGHGSWEVGDGGGGVWVGGQSCFFCLCGVAARVWERERGGGGKTRITPHAVFCHGGCEVGGVGEVTEDVAMMGCGAISISIQVLEVASARSQTQIMREVDALRMLEHEHVVRTTR